MRVYQRLTNLGASVIFSYRFYIEEREEGYLEERLKKEAQEDSPNEAVDPSLRTSFTGLKNTEAKS